MPRPRLTTCRGCGTDTPPEEMLGTAFCPDCRRPATRIEIGLTDILTVSVATITRDDHTDDTPASIRVIRTGPRRAGVIVDASALPIGPHATPYTTAIRRAETLARFARAELHGDADLGIVPPEHTP